MRKFTWVVVMLCLASLTGFSQTDNRSEGRLNRFIPFLIGDAVNSDYDEINPVLSVDEKTLYFSRINHPKNYYGEWNSHDIWFSEKQEDGSWSAAKRLRGVFNNNRYNALYSISENGDGLVSGIYTKNGRYKKRGLSVVHYDSARKRWLNPVKVKIPKFKRKDKGLTSNAFMSKSGKVIALSYTSHWQKANIRKVRISVQKENGKWKSPVTVKNAAIKGILKSVVNPYICDDDSTMYFSAYIRGSRSKYQNDIYVTHRLDNTFKRWTDPEPLSDTVNSRAKWENYYKHFDNDNWAMFSVSAAGEDANIYMVKLKEDRPYIDLSGIVLLEGKPMKEAFNISINGQIVDSVRINNDSSTYAIRLPFGKKYEIKAVAFEREAKIETIDATNQLEYLKVEKDLQLSLKPFLDLTGIVRVNGDLLRDPFKVIINGQEVDSVYTDTSTGEYSVKLPLGQVYELYVKSGNYIPKQSFVDVSADTKQTQIKKDLDMTAIPYVDIYGELINQKTDLPIDQFDLPKFVLNGQVADSIDTDNGNYKIRLPWGHKYTFQVQATDFDPVVATIDLLTVKNYQKIETNLYATPLENYATISGKVLNKKTDLPIRGDFFIDVDGSHSTSSKIDVNNSSYEIRLSLGKKSTLTASADEYFPISEVVDLTGQEGNVRIIKDLYLVPLKIGETILLNNIFFETGSSDLKEESFTDIGRVVDLMNTLPDLKIEIGGHTDSSGKDNFNMALSNSRAHSVVTYIVNQGISSDRVEFKGYGEIRPVASNLTPAGRAQNRRVEFKVLEQ